MMTIVYGCSKEDDDNNKNNKYQSKIEQILNIQQKLIKKW